MQASIAALAQWISPNVEHAFTATPVVTSAITDPTRAPAPRETTAKRLRKQNGIGNGIGCELIVVCPQCGDRFSIAREVPCLDPFIAEQHTQWLLDHFVWDHIQENKHRSSISLPNAEELTRWARSNRER